MSTPLDRDPLLPRPPGGLGAGASLALAAHAALIAALVGGLQWRTQTPAVMAAELWAAVPQTAAPRPVEAPAQTPVPAPPPPPPPPAAAPREAPAPAPDIAIERERRAREQAQQERARQEREQAQREQQAREREQQAREREQQARERARAERERQAAEARVAQAREEQLRRLMGGTGTGPATSTGTAAQDAAPSRSYSGRLVAHIKPNIVFTDQVPGNPAAEVEVRAGPGGTIVSRRLVKSSGHREWDEAVLRAIDRTGTLPRDVDGRVPPVILVSFRPQE